MHALSMTTLQKYKLSLIQEAVCSLEEFEFWRFNCVSVQQQASTLEPHFIVEIAVHSINKQQAQKRIQRLVLASERKTCKSYYYP